MISSVLTYFALSRLAKAMIEASDHQFTSLVAAGQACNRLYRLTKRDHLIVKHQQEPIYWVLRPKHAEALEKEGHIILTPRKRK